MPVTLLVPDAVEALQHLHVNAVAELFGVFMLVNTGQPRPEIYHPDGRCWYFQRPLTAIDPADRRARAGGGPVPAATTLHHPHRATPVELKRRWRWRRSPSSTPKESPWPPSTSIRPSTTRNVAAASTAATSSSTPTSRRSPPSPPTPAR